MSSILWGLAGLSDSLFRYVPSPAQMVFRVG